jgi:hypothetical protein
MTDKRDPGPRRAQAGGRAERLAAALRANLRRRKLQARGRSKSARQDAEPDPGRREPRGE